MAQAEQPSIMDKRSPNLLETASLWSILTFSWVVPVLKQGMEKTIEEKDLPELPEIETSAYNLQAMNRIWEAEKGQAKKANRRPSLHRAIFFHVLMKMWFVQPMMFFMSAARIIQALSLGRLIQFFDGTASRAEGYWYATLLVFCGLILLFLNHHTFYHTWKIGSEIRIATIASIYSKTLRLGSIFSQDSASSGHILNLASNDVERFLYASIFLSHLFWGPVEALCVLIIGLVTVGPPFAAGFALLFILVPLQFYLSKKFASYRSKIAKITDERVTLVSQVVAGIRVVKMSGWELTFLEKIRSIRRKEVKVIQEASRLKAWNEAIFFAANITVSVVIFLVQALTGDELKPRDVFTTFTLINIVQLTMTKFFSLAVMSVAEVNVSIRRVQEFLDIKEVGQSSLNFTKDAPCVLSFSDVTCYWETDDSDDEKTQLSVSNVTLGESSHDSWKTVALAGINLKFEMGGMYCIIGPVGSGKSALLQAISGELLPSKGRIDRKPASIAYATQDPFVMDGTVRENILFGLDYREEHYNAVVEACGLDVDFVTFQNGDMSIVGDRGVQVSGGQRARIGLARALYRDSDVLIADDPLSAVDARVGRLIFFEALQKLCVGKCVILATHQHQFIRDEQCVLMIKGRVNCVGSYEKCLGTAKDQFIPTADIEHKSEEKVPGEENSKSVVTTGGKKEEGDWSSDEHKESKDTGVVKLSTWIDYAKGCGGIYVACLLVLLYGLSQASVLITIAQVGKWAERPLDEQVSTSLQYH
jgi:ATP-binding cassette subfamily C (CFTR/MRP) protein 4